MKIATDMHTKVYLRSPRQQQQRKTVTEMLDQYLMRKNIGKTNFSRRAHCQLKLILIKLFR